MSTLKRIKPEAVVSFFKAHPEVRAIRGHFVAFMPGKDGAPPRLWGCCGLSSRVAEARGGVDLLRMLDCEGGLSHHSLRVLADELGTPGEYIRGFVAGWDDCPISSHSGKDRAVGHLDGKAAYQATMRALQP